MDLQWSFDSNTNFDDWIVTSDQDHNEGFSHCQMSLSPTGKGLFSGVLSTETVKDGKVKYAGYCNFHSIPPTRSFKRETYHDWTPYTHLVKLKISFFFHQIGCLIHVTSRSWGYEEMVVATWWTLDPRAILTCSGMTCSIVLCILVVDLIGKFQGWVHRKKHHFTVDSIKFVWGQMIK